MEGGKLIVLTTMSSKVCLIDAIDGSIKWKQGIGGYSLTGSAVVEDVIIGVSAGRKQKMKAWTKDGIKLWEHGSKDVVALQSAGNYCLVVEATGRVKCLRANDGGEVWETIMQPPVNPHPSSDKDRIRVIDGTGTLHLFSLIDGVEIKTIKLPSSVLSYAVWGEHMLLLSGNGDLARIDGDGKEIWKVKTSEDIKDFKFVEETIVVADSTGVVTAYKTSDGSKIWQAELGQAMASSLLLSTDGTSVFVGGSRGRICQWKLTDGSFIKEWDATQRVLSLCLAGGRLFGSCGDAKLRTFIVD